MNNDYPLPWWSMKQVANRDSFAFCILDVDLKMFFTRFSFFHEIIKFPADKE